MRVVALFMCGFAGFVLQRRRKAQGLFEGKLACRHTDFEVLGGLSSRKLSSRKLKVKKHCFQ